MLSSGADQVSCRALTVCCVCHVRAAEDDTRAAQTEVKQQLSDDLPASRLVFTTRRPLSLSVAPAGSPVSSNPDKNDGNLITAVQSAGAITLIQPGT